jgi:hypothetical protein
VTKKPDSGLIIDLLHVKFQRGSSADYLEAAIVAHYYDYY